MKLSLASRLRAQAEGSARWRGHTLDHWETLSPTLQRATCVECGAEVDVNTRPAPNEIDIGGSAVAVNCKS